MISEHQRWMPTRLRDRLVLPISLVVLVTLVGTAGYYWLGQRQDATLLDALFMTIITITTIGYGEVIHLDEAGRVFTIFIAITGIGSLYYSLTVTMDYLVMARIADPLGIKKMQREISTLKGHIIVAGLGRVGRQAAKELWDAGAPFVLIDPKPEALTFAVQQGYLIVQGDASDDSVLESVGIQKAKGLIVTSGDDAVNIYIVLSARVLNPDLFIISRAVVESSIPKLTRAGANRALSPHAIGGRRLAHLILSPTVVDFFETVISKGDERINLEGIEIREDSPIVGKTIAELKLREHSGANILVILRGSEVLPNPDDRVTLTAGDQLLALGTSTQLSGLEEQVGPLS
jgi:voltage-gated potassium channel